MSQHEPIPTVILAPKPDRPRRKPAGEPIPWAKLAIGASVVWMFVVIVVTIYFSLQGSPARRDEQALNALPGGRGAERERPEKQPDVVVKPEEPIAKDEFVDCERIGVEVKFMKEPVDAFRRAREEKKMVFMVHLSGNLEDPEFT